MRIHLIVDANGNPMKFIIIGGERSDFTEAVPLNIELKAEHPIADQSHDSNEIIRFVKTSNAPCHST